MPYDDRREAILDQIVSALESGQETLVPVLGPAFPRSQLQISRDYARTLAEADYNPWDNAYPLDTADLSLVGKYYVRPRRMIGQLRSGYARCAVALHDAPLDPLHDVLASLVVPTYLTAAYNDLMRVAMRPYPREPRSDFFRWSEKLQETSPEGGLPAGYEPHPGTPLVYHLFGHLETSRSLALTEDDYLDWLMYVAFQDGKNGLRSTFPPAVMRALQSPCLLLLGFSLEDWSLRVLMRLVKRLAPEEGPHPCLLVHPRPGASQWDLEDRAYDYLSPSLDLAQVSLWPGPTDAFATALKRALDEAEDQGRIRRFKR